VSQRTASPSLVGSSLLLILCLASCSEGFLDVYNADEMIHPVFDAGFDSPDSDAQLQIPDADAEQEPDTDPGPEGCVDDEFAPMNFRIGGAATLAPGASLDLILCDNQTEGVTSHNWFTLGTTTEIDVTLSWPGESGLLRLDVWVSEGAPEERDYFADAGTGINEISYQGQAPEDNEVFVRVFFQPGRDLPEPGAPYTLSRAN
jgi:hypothetical protein